jgi:transposase
MPVRAIVTDGTTADCTQAIGLVSGFAAGHLLADKAYDTDAILSAAMEQGIVPVIPSKKNRKVPREHDPDLYKVRHLVENAFLHLKRWRGLSTRYAKNVKSFVAAVNIRC